MKIPKLIQSVATTLKSLAVALGLSAAMHAVTASAATTSETYQLGASGSGTLIQGGVSLPWIAQGTRPVGSILREVAINVRLDDSPNGSWASDLNVLLEGALQIGSDGGDPDWANGQDSTAGATVIDTKTAGTGFPATIDLNVAGLFLKNTWGNATWSGSVTVTYDVPGPASIISFGLAGIPGQFSGTSIALTVPHGTDLTALAPIFTMAAGATCDHGSGTTYNFTNPVHFIVTGSDNSTVDYTVTISEAQGLIAKTYDNTFGDSFLDPIANLMAVTPSGTAIQTANIEYGDFAASFPGITENETFAILWEGWFDVTKDGPGAYTFGTDSDDGSVIYLDLNNDGDFADEGEMIVDNKGSHGNQQRTGTVMLDLDAVRIAIGYYDDGGGEAMTARFKKGDGLDYAALDPINGSFGHFVAEEPPPDPTKADLKNFSLPGNPATYAGTDLTVVVPHGTDVTALAPTFGLSNGATCDHVSGTACDFSTPVHYVVTSADTSNIKDYLVTVVVLPPSGIVHVNFDTELRTGLVGPAGGAGTIWNERIGTAGLTANNLLDSTGAVTSIGFTCDATNVDAWGNPGQKMLTSAAFTFGANYPTNLEINGLTPGKKYALYLASFHPNELGGRSRFTTNNPATTVGAQSADNLGTNGNSFTWVQGVNYVRFDNLEPDANNRITITMVSGTPDRRAYLSGFQLLEGSPAPVNPFDDWMAGFDFSSFNNPDLSGTGDPDGDGISNRVEFAYDLDPSFAEDFANGIVRERWENLGGGRVTDLTGNRARFLFTADERDLAPGVDESGHGDNFGSRYRGFITAPATGAYRFWIAGHSEAELWIADGSITKTITGQTVPLTNRFGKLRLATVRDSTEIHAFDQTPSQLSRVVQLQAGVRYYFEVLHKQGGGGDQVSVAWQPPGSTREIIPAMAFDGDFTEAADLDNDNLPDDWEQNHGLNPTDNGLSNYRDGQYGDLDADGLNNLEEYQLGTDPNDRDTDNDGLSDKDERDFYHSNPLGPDTQSAPYVTLPPHNFVDATGHWNRDSSGSLTALERRSAISYTFVIGNNDAGVYQISLTGGAAGVPRPVEDMPLVFSLNGSRIGSAILTSINGGSATAATLTPWLKKGTYTLTIFHDNYRAALKLRIDSLSILKLAGADSNNNQTPDWIEQRLAANNHLTHIPATSLTSPVCIEGVAAVGVGKPDNNKRIPGLTLKVDGENVPPMPSIDSTFYADVPLSKTGPVTLTAAFQSGAINESHSITWAPTNLRANKKLYIRKGDSLLLDAWNNAGVPGNNVSFTVTMDGVPLADDQGHTTHTSGQPFIATFSNAGTYTLVTTYGNHAPKTTNVHVLRASFGPDLSARVHFPRDWTPSALGHKLTIQADSHLTWTETTTEGSSRSFSVMPSEAGQHYVIARMPDDVVGAPSAIVDRGTVNAFYLAYIDETGDAQLIHTYPDGTSLMRGSLVAVGLPPDVYIRLSSYFQGTVFMNGSNTLWLTAADFDQNGVAYVYFEWNGEGSPQMCTFVDLFTTEPPPEP